MRNRRSARAARDDKRAWVVKRRERTRQLIELGGLVAKAGLIELTDDDRAVIFGILVDAAASLRSEDRDKALLLWWRRGTRAFQALAPEREPRA
ncbi:conjugal transfer protein TraD [Sphingomonas suaedae]|uniref:Conjugal transfer protein TraD n=1 Tax=Sphingomonas suaedae TaxID=2599297 RepID=A0A518RFC8_9SPHN|nr:conjugal transfer protein TraD [Sphingomonas suaedae]